VVPQVAAALVGIAIFGAGLPVAIVAVITLIQRPTPAELQGRTYAAGTC
jgi:hypothetical protein